MKSYLLLCYLTFISAVCCLSCSVFLSDERAALHYQNKGRKQMEKKRYRAAERLLEKSYELMPRNPAVTQLLPQVYVQRRKFSKAADYVERFAVVREDTVRAPETCYHLGLFLLFYGAQEKQNANALLVKAERHLRKAMQLDSLRYMPSFRLQAESNAALGMLHILYSSYAYNPQLEKPERLHKKVLPSELNLARTFCAIALRYDPNHAAARHNLQAIEHGLTILDQAIPTLDLNPFVCEPTKRQQTASVQDTSAENQSSGITANSPLRLLNLTMLDSLSRYDELILVLDISGSMDAQMFPGRSETRMEVMKLIALELTKIIKTRTRIGCVTVGGECGASPQIYLKTKTPRHDIFQAISHLQIDGMTPLHCALKSAPDLFSDGRKSSSNRRGICVLSDGLNSCPDPDMICQIAQDLAVLNIQTNVISLLLEDEMRNQTEYEAYLCMSTFGGGMLVAPSGSGAFKSTTTPNEILTFDVLLPAFKLDRCVSVKNLVMLPATEIRDAFDQKAVPMVGSPPMRMPPATN